MENLNKLRRQIRLIINEMANLSESQKTPDVDDFISSFFSRANFYIGGNLVVDEMGKKELALECINELKSLVSQVQTGELPYENFYILKFSDFTIRTPKGIEPLSFEDQTSSESIFKIVNNSFLLYAYHDTIFKVIPYNVKWDTDAKIEAEASKFINSVDFQKQFSSKNVKTNFRGEIKSLWMGRKVIVYSEFFNPKKQEEPTSKEKTPFAKAKKKYRVNTPLLHKLFGKGIIKKTEKVKEEPDGDLYNLEVEFPEYGLKKIRVKQSV